MVDLRTTYMGVSLKNPLIVGSCPTTAYPEICKKAADNGWAGVVLKTLFPTEGIPPIPKVMPRPFYKLMDTEFRYPWRPKASKLSDPVRGNKRGQIPPDYTLTINFITGPRGPVTTVEQFYPGEEYFGYINRTKELVGGDCKVIASIFAFTEHDWEKYCDLVNKSDTDMVELNLGCGIVGHLDKVTGKWARGPAGNDLEFIEKWAKFCGERLEKPWAVKLSPTAPDAVSFARLIEQNGARGIQFGDAGLALHMRNLAVDPETLSVGVFPGYLSVSSFVPPLLFPFICGTTASMRLNGIKMDISACGGIREAMDIIRLIMVGATSTQVASATIVQGLDIGNLWLEEITAWMERKGYNSLKEIQDILLPKITFAATTDEIVAKLPKMEVMQRLGGPTPKDRVVLKEKKCISCGWCESVCLHLAIKMEDTTSRISGKVPKIDDKQCEICGLCVALCPSQALSINPRI
jgi:dihydropyrimidine dehydrogenase (NAD+) subunit PreA